MNFKMNSIKNFLILLIIKTANSMIKTILDGFLIRVIIQNIELLRHGAVFLGFF